jgi:hypothetical protein
MTRRLDAWALWLDRRPAMVLTFLAAVYLVSLQPLIHRMLWFDELHTFYIAQAPTVARFIEEVRRLDWNPPLMFALVRGSFTLFGISELTTRLPAVLGYFLASACMFVFVRRRAGALWAAVGVALFWYSPFSYFASEARPYGILLGFMGVTLVAWDSAATRSKRGWALAGIAAGNTGMMLSHVFGPLVIMPFCVGELVRNWRQRRIDWPMWAALLLPLISAVVYIPLVQSAEAAVFPPENQGSIQKAVWFYSKVFVQVLPPLLAAAAVAFAIALRRRRASGNDDAAPGFAAHEVAFFVPSLLSPALLNAVAMRTHTAFYDRYGITMVLTMCVFLALFVAYESRLNRVAGFAAAVVTVGFLLLRVIGTLVAQPPAYSSKFTQVHPELPFVDNSALTFLEMDHREDSAFLRRLYFLSDRASAIQYAHSTLTEGMPVLKQYFPVRANTPTYSDFVAQHRHFLVYGMIDEQGEWLLKKLRAEGATLTEVGTFDTPYLDSNLYEVTLPSGGVPHAR